MDDQRDAGNGERREKGLDIMRHLIGDDMFEKRQSSTNGFNQDCRRMSEDYCFGEIWADNTLPLKTRSLLCVAMLAAINRPGELRIHIGGALNNGCTPAEIRAALLQAMVYCGLPAGVEGTRIAEDVLRERGIDPGAGSPSKRS